MTWASRTPPACFAAGLVLATMLCGCAPSADEVKSRHEAGGTVGAPAAQPVKPAAVEVGARDAELVTAVALNKGKLPLDVRFRLDVRPVIGQPVKIELVVTPAQLAQIRSMQFRLQPGAGLLLQDATELAMPAATPGVAIRREIVVVPQSAGVLELEALATVETNSESLSQTYAIPLIVPPPANPG